MPIVVKPAGHEFGLEFTAGNDKVRLKLKALKYKTKSEIAGLTTKARQGEVYIDTTMTIFYNIKYAVKDVEGIIGPDGKAYELKFEDEQKEALTDECVDELLSASISDALQFAALDLSKPSYPDEVLHPATGKPLEGVKLVPLDKIKGPRKKPSKQSK